MVIEKGAIDLTGVNTDGGFKFILEFLEKAKEDSLNIKPVEANAIIELTKVLQSRVKAFDEYKAKAGLWDSVEKKLTPSQTLALLKGAVGIK